MDDGPIHTAVQETLPEGHLLVRWVLVACVTYDDERYLEHRSCGPDGQSVFVWEALGMLQAGVIMAQNEILEMGRLGEDDGPD